MNNLEWVVGTKWTTKRGSTAIITSVEHTKESGKRGDKTIYGTVSMWAVSVSGRLVTVPTFEEDGVSVSNAVIANNVQRSIDKLEGIGEVSAVAESGQLVKQWNGRVKYEIKDDVMERLEKTFTYHPAKGNQITRYMELRDKAKELAYLIVELSPSSREQSLALTTLEECVMHANAGIARNE